MIVAQSQRTIGSHSTKTPNTGARTIFHSQRKLLPATPLEMVTPVGTFMMATRAVQPALLAALSLSTSFSIARDALKRRDGNNHDEPQQPNRAPTGKRSR
ncbi:MAG: hypothetical protein ACREV5_20695 [Steroidobacter sp.]